MRGLYEPTQNQLLAALPDTDLQRVQKYLTPVMLRAGEAVYEAGSQVNYVYFPTSAVVSLLYVMSNGSSSDVAMVGKEGLIGVSSFMGGETTLSRAVVQCSGHAFQIPGRIVSQEFMRSGAIQRLLLRYMQTLLVQTAQTAVCNRHHSLEQQLCRWLLISLDRMSGNQLYMTQEWIANMLGVRREGVTEAAGRLASAGIIEYRRGHITILDRKALECRSCECYAVVKMECDRLLPKLAPAVAARTTRPLYPQAPVYAQPRIARGIAAEPV